MSTFRDFVADDELEKLIGFTFLQPRHYQDSPADLPLATRADHVERCPPDLQRWDTIVSLHLSYDVYAFDIAANIAAQEILASRRAQRLLGVLEHAPSWVASLLCRLQTHNRQQFHRIGSDHYMCRASIAGIPPVEA